MNGGGWSGSPHPPLQALPVVYAHEALVLASVNDGDDAIAIFSSMTPLPTSGLKTLGFQFISSLFPDRSPRGQEVRLGGILARVFGIWKAAWVSAGTESATVLRCP